MAVYDQEIVDTTPQYLQTKSYSAQKFRTWFSDICQAGAFSDTDFALSLLGGLAYRMSSGKAYVLGQQVADQGMYRVSSLANADLAVGAGHATLPRLDQVILRVMDNTHDGGGFNEARIETVPGTATSGATLDNRSGAANLTTLGEASKNVLLMYDILMPAAASSISGGNVRRRATPALLGYGVLPDQVPFLSVAQFQAIRDFPDGMEVYVIVDATNRVIWHFRYNAAGSTYKWEFIGGPPLTAHVATFESVTTTWQNLATDGPSITVPLAGDYIVEGGATGSSNYQDGSTLEIGIAEGNTTPFLQGRDGAGHTDGGAPNFNMSGVVTFSPYRRAAVAISTVLKLRYQYNSPMTIGYRSIAIKTYQSISVGGKMANIEKARELGYEVSETLINADGKKHYRVVGQGVDTVYAEDQEDSWKFLVDPKAHEHRENMFKHNDPEDDFTMTDEEIRESAIAASVSAGLLDEDEAKEMRKAVISQ